MDWKIDKTRPICPQLCELLSVQIASGELTANSRLKSVREVAVLAGVNPNTVQKSFEQLERQGLIYSVRGTGWFVAENAENAKVAVKNLIEKKTETYFSEMEKLGLSPDEIKDYIKEWDI